MNLVKEVFRKVNLNRKALGLITLYLAVYNLILSFVTKTSLEESSFILLVLVSFIYFIVTRFLSIRKHFTLKDYSVDNILVISNKTLPFEKARIKQIRRALEEDGINFKNVLFVLAENTKEVYFEYAEKNITIYLTEDFFKLRLEEQKKIIKDMVLEHSRSSISKKDYKSLITIYSLITILGSIQATNMFLFVFVVLQGLIFFSLVNVTDTLSLSLEED